MLELHEGKRRQLTDFVSPYGPRLQHDLGSRSDAEAACVLTRLVRRCNDMLDAREQVCSGRVYSSLIGKTGNGQCLN